MTLQRTTAQRKVAALRSFYRIVQGGMSASKTYTIIPLLIDYAIKHPRKRITVVGPTVDHLKDGAIADFTAIMEATGNYNENRYNKNDRKYTFTNKSHIKFTSLDREGKGRGPRRDVLFINEANMTDWESANQLMSRTHDFVYVDYNPSHEFWVHEHLFDDPRSQVLTLTYLDNEAASPATIAYIKDGIRKAEAGSKYWQNWVRVYVHGQLGSLEGVIFPEGDAWEIVPDSALQDAQRLGCGLDFGFTNDPTAHVAGYRYNGHWLYDQVSYGTGLYNADIKTAAEAYGVLRTKTYADSASPNQIAELRRLGMVNITGAVKGHDSVNAGIKIMQEEKFYVTQRSVDIITELRKYTWAKDRHTGKSLNYPVDEYNHSIDAIRYLRTMHNRRTHNYGIRRKTA